MNIKKNERNWCRNMSFCKKTVWIFKAIKMSMINSTTKSHSLQFLTQVSSSISGPSQSSPSFLGGGLLQVWFRYTMSSGQGHADHSDQSLHSPSTVDNK